MEDVYCFNLSEYEFECLTVGTKTAHLFINDAKHKVLAIGNVINFVSSEGEEKQQIDAVIENILYFPGVTEAFESVGKQQCGYRPNSPLEKASDIFLSNESYEQIEKYGIGVILFKKK